MKELFSEEWKWELSHGLKWKQFLPFYSQEVEAQDSYHEMLNILGQWCQEKLHPRSKSLDENGPGEVREGKTIPSEELRKTYEEAAHLGFFGLCAPKAYGGQEAPLSLLYIAHVLISRASLSFSAQLTFFNTMIDMLDRYADQSIKDRIIPEIIAGNICGSMGLTEANTGSDLQSMKMMAKKSGERGFLLSGTKTFITNPGGGFCLVLSKTENAGLSLFFVEQNIDDQQNYWISKKEEKLGLRGSFTCEVVFKNAVGHLMGEEGKGLSIMFHLMNMARLGVGSLSLGVMEATLSYVEEYASQRVQFGQPLRDLPLYRKNLRDWTTEVNGFRALFVETLNHFELCQRLDLKKRQNGILSVGELRILEEAKTQLRIRTPLIKYYGSELATRITQKGIQSLGGYGIMTEYPVERYHRDALTTLLFEGTSQIQALMAFKDFISGILRNPEEFFAPILLENPATLKLKGISAENKEYQRWHYQLIKEMMALLLRVLEVKNLPKLLQNKESLLKEKMDLLTPYAEDLCISLSYLETLKSLIPAQGDPLRSRLFWDYSELIYPQFSAHLMSLGRHHEWKQARSA